VTPRTQSPFATLLRRLAVPGAVKNSSALQPRWWWLLGLLAPVYVALAAAMPPADDEVYYWCWSKTLQFSYYDHPGMSAYMIRLSTALLGDTLFAIRLPAVVASLGVFAVIGYLTRPRTLLPLIAVTPLFTFGAILVTPDTPLMIFWALYLVWMVKVHERLDSEQRIPLAMWVLGGVILGCGILGKYTMALGMMFGFVAFLIAGGPRRWFGGYVLHGVVAFLTASPILIHNIRHEFVPILYQWKHSMGSPEPGWKPFLEFAGVQLLLFGTLPFWILGWAIPRRRELLADPRLRVCFCLFMLPFAFFLFKATRGRLEGNWALACYIALWPLAALWYESIRASRFWRRMAVAAFSAPLICISLVSLHLVSPFSLLSPEKDRIYRQTAKLELSRAVTQRVRELHSVGIPLFTTDYQWTSMLRFAGTHTFQIDGMTRPSHFTQNDSGPAPKLTDHDRVMILTEGPIPEEFLGSMVRTAPEIQFPLMVRGKHVTTMWLLGYERGVR